LFVVVVVVAATLFWALRTTAIPLCLFCGEKEIERPTADEQTRERLLSSFLLVSPTKHRFNEKREEGNERTREIEKTRRKGGRQGEGWRTRVI